MTNIGIVVIDSCGESVGQPEPQYTADDLFKCGVSESTPRIINKERSQIDPSHFFLVAVQQLVTHTKLL